MRTIVKHSGARYIRAASANGCAMRKSSVAPEKQNYYVFVLNFDKGTREIIAFGLSKYEAAEVRRSESERLIYNVARCVVSFGRETF